jgi:hypothetical protein
MMHALPTITFRPLAAIAVSLLLLTGCSRPAPASLATNPMAAPAMELSDATSRPKRFRALFVDGAAPSDAERKRFANFMFQVVQVNPISDSEAALHILVDDDAGRRIGETDWSVVKADGTWKLKTAPLP